MKKNALLLFMTLIFCKAGLLAQPYRDNEWVLGANNLVKNRIIDFNLNQSPATIDSAAVGTPFTITNTMICDTAGQLLFYSNGVKIFNKAHAVMQNGAGLSPCPHSTSNANNGLDIIQAVVILPKPGNANRYYVFHTAVDLADNPNPLPRKPGTIFYSEVDMNLAGGMGALTRKNDTLFRDTLVVTGPVSVRHANGRDWWLISHKWKTNQYYKWLVTPDSIYGPFSQAIGSSIYRNSIAADMSQWTFSPDGSKFAVVSQPYDLNKKVDLFNFDRCTGMFSSFTLLTITDTAQFAAGCSFSPNSRYLYVSTNYFVYQFDTDAPNIQNSMIMVKAHDGGNSVTQPDYFYVMQAGPDGKIYMIASSSVTKLHVIHSPDSAGLQCNVAFRDFDLKNIIAYALPIFPNYVLGALTGSPCDTLTGINDIEQFHYEVKAHPNPVQEGEEFGIRYLLPQNKTGRLQLFDVKGREVYTAYLAPFSSLHRIKAKWEAGMYVVKISTSLGSMQRKLVIIR